MVDLSKLRALWADMEHARQRALLAKFDVKGGSEQTAGERFRAFKQAEDRFRAEAERLAQGGDE